MQLTDLADVQVVPAHSIGMKGDDSVVKLTFRSGTREEEIVLFPGLFCHALGFEDDALSTLMKDKTKLLEDSRVSTRLQTVLQKFW